MTHKRTTSEAAALAADEDLGASNFGETVAPTYTPGPWQACDRVVVVTVEGHGYGTHIADCAVGGANGKMQIANARLIAAAPDMLAALKAVVSVADRATVEFDMARAAIAKAEGRS